MHHIVTFLFSIFICIGTVLMCMSGSNLPKVNNKRELVLQEQEAALEQCIDKFTDAEHKLMKYYKEHWVNDGIINPKNVNLISAAYAVECLTILSEHQAKKFFCPSFADKYKEDLILAQLMKKYEKCVTDKEDELRRNILRIG